MQPGDAGFGVGAGIGSSGADSVAGPVVAAMVIIPKSVGIPGVRDSKQLSAEERERIYGLITTHPDFLWSTWGPRRNPPMQILSESGMLDVAAILLEKSKNPVMRADGRLRAADDQSLGTAHHGGGRVLRVSHTPQVSAGE